MQHRSKEEYKRARREKTFEHALDLVDDLQFFRQVLASESATAGDIRRLSAQLRRLLVDNTLERIAAPRIGKITLRASDITFLLKSNSERSFSFLGVGPATVFGVTWACAILESGSGPRNLTGYHPERTKEVDLDNFGRQGVMIWEGTWISRRQVIKYIANVASGVHSGEDESHGDRLIRRIRSFFKLRVENGIPTMSTNLDLISSINIPPIVSRSDLDWALIELWAAASFITTSPDVICLEEYISSEAAI